jgi:anti-sigma-K factor RskA
MQVGVCVAAGGDTRRAAKTRQEEVVMSGEAGGWMWILVNVGAVAVLGAALAYGVWTWKARRSPAVERLRRRKTEELHRQPDPDESAPLGGGRR